MARRIGEKAQRAFEFLFGLGDPQARQALAKHGFTDADYDDGWARLIALSKVPVRAPGAPAAEHLAALDAWENRWFPIIDVVLRTHHEPVHDIVFRNLRQTKGVEVMVSVKTLLDRLELLAQPKKNGGLGAPGQRAREHLLRRGLTDEVLAEARTLLARVHEVPDDAPVVDPEERAAAEERLWTWYLEWSGIARATIQERRVLNALGFRGRSRKKKS